MQSKITKSTIVKHLKQYTQFFTAAILMSASVYGILTIIPQQSLTAKAAFPTSRDPYKWPFSRDSIWNMPVGSNAQYASAGMPAPDTYAADPHNIYRLQNPKPTQFETGILPLDDGMISDISPNDTTNRVATVIDNNGDFYQIQPGRRNSPTSNVTGYLRNEADSNYANLDAEGRRCVKIQAGACYLNIKGKGIDGSHWGSGLSAIGGGLKSGDLTSTEDIRHALNIEVSGWKYLKCNDGDNNFNDYKAKGFMWPADRNDSYACPGGYGGNLDYFRMGALLALKPDLDINSLGLQTDAAKKMAKAFQDYGGYVTDDSYGVNSNSTIFNFTYEKEVATEFKAKYGHDFNIYWDTGSLRQSPFFKDMDKIITQLNVITNNTPDNIGGGGTPRQQLAPCFVGEVGCTNTPVTSSAPAVGSVSSCSNNSQSIINILPLGDSITEEGDTNNSYRAKEWVNLTNAGLANKVKFVGLRNDSSPQAPNMATTHGGYGGYATNNFIDKPPFWGWDGNLNNNPMDSLMATNPSIVQIMLGTNDGPNSGLDYNQSKTYWTSIINKIRQFNPSAKIIIGHAPVPGTDYRDQVVVPVVAQLNTTQSPITMVEFTGYERSQDTTDGTHNDASGAMKMADTFTAAIVPIINNLLSCQVPSYPPISSAMSSSSVISSTANSSLNSSSAPTSSSSCPVNSGLTKISSSMIYGGSPSYGNNPAVTFDKAFDGNINTFYDYANANGGYSGMDINTFPKSVSLICFYPRSGVDGNNIPLSPRTNGGRFQGSNDKVNYTDLATINGVVSTPQWYSIPVTNTATYKYLRYLSPDGSYGNIAEVEFYTAIPLATNSSSSAISSPASVSSAVSSAGLTPGILNLKVNLQGAYSESTNTMRVDLKNKNLIPLTSPYTESPLVATSIPADTVDWILIEFKNSSGVSVAKKSGLLKSNGSLTESDGSGFKLPASLTNGNYNLIVKNRNHLSISTSVPINFINSGGAVTAFDFTTNSNVKANNQAILANGKYGLKFGNANSDNAINAGDRIRTRVTQDRSGIYATEDINMDGNISSIDRVLARLNYDSLESI